MTTIAEGVFTPAELIDSIASAALGFAPWSEPESGNVANDQSTNDWYNNARLLYHADANLYVLMYVPNIGRCYYDGKEHHNGWRMVFSTTGIRRRCAPPDGRQPARASLSRAMWGTTTTPA